MKRMFGICAGVVLSLFLLNSCSGEKKSAESVDTKEGGAIDSSKIVAVVNGVNITESDLLKKIEEGKTNQIQMGGSFRKEALANLINYNLLGMAAEREEIIVSEENLEERITQIKEGYQSDEQFLERLKDLGMDEALFRGKLIKQIKIENLIEKKTEGIESPSEEQLIEYYDSHPESFKEPKQVNASHILISVNKDDDEETKKKKKEKLEKIIKEIKDGASFSENAALYSDCPSKSKGGNLGFFKEGDMVKPFSDMAFSMDKDEVSGIVETRFGYHIVKVIDKKEASIISFEEARENIVSYMEGMGKTTIVNDYLTDLRSEANIEYADSSLIQP